MVLIRVTCLSKEFANGVVALSSVSLEIEAGSFTVILGPSGAGKSTLLRSINGLEMPSEGNVEIEGEILSKSNLRRIRSRVAMVFQQFNLVGRLNVLTNVLTGRLSHLSRFGRLASLVYLFSRKDVEIAQLALAHVGLTDKAWERADRLSGGQQQRVGIARALAQQPQVILADEPVASLDLVTGEEIMNLLRRASDDGITVVVSLHQVEFAKRFADRIVGLNTGRVVFDGKPRDITPDSLRLIYQSDEISIRKSQDQ